MIITLTIHERRIIFQILNLIMTADLIVKQDEIDYMDDIFRRFELSVDEFDHMDNIDLDYLKKEFSTLSSKHQEYAKKLFIGMANCDGCLDPRELAIIENL